MRVLITALALLCAVAASGQIYIDSYRFAGASGDLLLDSFSGASAAYSLRKLDKDYTGNAIMVRRSSDGDSLNIGFSGNYLDTVALKTFCGTSATDSCFVRKWYDQSSNNLHATMTTNFNQPSILVGGAIQYDKGLVAIIFNGSQYLEVPSSQAAFKFLHDGTKSSNFVVTRPGSVADPGVNYTFFGNNGGATANIGIWFAYQSASGFNNAIRSFISKGVSGQIVANPIDQNQITPNTVNLLYASYDADNATLSDRVEHAVNGGTILKTNTNNDIISTANATASLTIGTLLSGSNLFIPLVGSLQEIVLYNSDKTTDRTAIRDNINNFYNIY